MKKLLLLLAFLAPGLSQAADCFVSSYGYIGTAKDGKVMQVPVEPPLFSEKVTFTTTSVASTAFPAGTSLVGIVCNNSVTYFAVGSSPTATTSSHYLAADQWFYFAVSSNGLQVAFRTP